MGSAAGVWLALALLIDVASSSWAGLWPLRFHLAKLKRARTVLELYSPAGSNLDVLVLSSSRCIILFFTFCVAAGRSRQTAERTGWALLLARTTAVCSQVLESKLASMHAAGVPAASQLRKGQS